jgi:hypothetical protein
VDCDLEKIVAGGGGRCNNRNFFYVCFPEFSRTD